MTIRAPKIQITKRGCWKIINKLARTSLPEIAFVSTFILSKYQLNIDFSYPAEIVIPIVMFATLSTVVFYSYKLVLKRNLAAHLASLPLMYGLYSFQLIFSEHAGVVKVLLPAKIETSFTLSVIFAMLMAILAGFFGYALARLMSWHRLHALQLPKVLMFFILFLFLSQIFKVGVRLIQIYPELSYEYTPQLPAKDPSKTITNKPDVYYIVLDRYASSTTLQKTYGYDNGQFINYLSSQGFVTRDNAYSNYPFTMSSISSTLAMGYHTSLGQKFGNDSYQTAFPYRNILNNPPIAKVLKSEGYTYNQVSSWWDFTRIGVNSDTNPTLSYRLSIFGMHFYFSDLTRDIFNKSIFAPIFTKGISFGDMHVFKYDLDRNPPQNFEAQLATLKGLSSSKHDRPQFTFTHILMPHDPYVFDEDGTAVDYDPGRNDNGTDETTKYVNQLKYLDSRMQDLVATMRKNSPNAVVIIQADEGPYPKQFRFALSPNHYYNPLDLPTDQMQQKLGVIASYYMPGVDQNTVKTNIVSSVDPFRFVLSNYLGYKVDMLPDCQFSNGNKYSLYSYELITEKLTGNKPDPACSKF